MIYLAQLCWLVTRIEQRYAVAQIHNNVWCLSVLSAPHVKVTQHKRAAYVIVTDMY